MRKKRTANSASKGADGDSALEFADVALGQRLREFRASQKLSQAELAKLLERSQQFVSDMEAGATPISAAVLARLRHFGLDVDAFLAQDVDWNGDAVEQFIHRMGILHAGGIEEVHPDRAEALKSFRRYLQREHRQMDITGSSLKGIFNVHPDIFEVMKSQILEGVHARILLTDPRFSVLRAFTEGRDSKMIEGEIDEAFHKYCRAFQDLAPERVHVRVVLHPPTICGVFLAGERRALINPYTLTVEAFSTHTFICRDTGAATCMFQKYHLHHFENPFTNNLTNQVSINLNEYPQSDHETLHNACKSIDDALKPFKGKGLRGRSQEE